MEDYNEIKNLDELEYKIKNLDELEFVIFCIENLAIKIQRDPEAVYKVLKENDILNSYIIPGYDILHTQSKDYITNDILEILKERGIEV